MFSPVIGGPPGASVRSTRSRRRQRSSNEGSLALPPPKRLRSALNENTFVAPDVEPEMEEVKATKRASSSYHDVSREQTTPAQRELAVRPKKSKRGERSGKGDGSLLLLPSLPDRLRTDATSPQHGAIHAESGYALSLSHAHAIVWPYATTLHVPEIFTFKLNHSARHASGPLPLGSLVSASASTSEPGLVVVDPASAKVTYWESVTSASTLDIMRQQRKGVEYTIPALYSGETVTQIVNAESAGFVLAFDTGRTAYMSVRDGQGRPDISVQFLRSNTTSMGTGIFGSIRKVLTGTPWGGDIAAIRSGPQEKVGERDVIIATERGQFQAWTLHRGGHNTLRSEAQGREKIFEAICGIEPTFADIPIDSLHVIDFTYTPKTFIHSQVQSQAGGENRILVLTSVSIQQNAYYSLVELIITKDDVVIESVRPIKAYSTPINTVATSKPRLYLPNPTLIAYVIFDRAIVIISMANHADSPESQLRMESRIQPAYFEDAVEFRNDNDVEIVGSGMEEPHDPPNSNDDPRSRQHKAKHPAAVLLVRGGGILRVAAIDTAKLTSSGGRQITAKSKLEQAVFFSTIEKTPLSFKVRPELQFPAQEVGEAALMLSEEILSSRNPNIIFTASIDQNLRQRAASLRVLADYLMVTGVELDRLTRWKLLWAAEKMAVATTIWEQYDARLRERPTHDKRGILPDVVSYINENMKTEPVPEIGERDPVRHWFLKDVGNVGVALPWTFQVIKYAYHDGKVSKEAVVEMLVEANRYVIGALNCAFEFRSQNLGTYGLTSEPLAQGILETGYETLPEIWTSMFVVVENLRKQYEIEGYIMKNLVNEGKENNMPHYDQVRMQYPALLDVAMKATEEHTRWAIAQADPQLQIHAEQILLDQELAQDRNLKMLAEEMGMPDAAMDLAEKYCVLPTLAHILVVAIARCSVKFKLPNPQDRRGPSDRLLKLKARLNQYFDNHGAAWASALYERYIELGAMSKLLDEHLEQAAYLTSFLHSKPEYAKVAWLQDIIREQDTLAAGGILIGLGMNREQDLWSQKIELSLGKLSLLSNQEKYGEAVNLPAQDLLITAVDDKLSLVDIQDQVFNYVFPTIVSALDESAELQLVKDAHGNPTLETLPALRSIFEEGLEHLLKHEAMDPLLLIDLLTLLCQNTINDNGQEFINKQFFLALRASSRMRGTVQEKRSTQRLIWRRCMVKDDWKEINDTSMRDDFSVEERLRATILHNTFLHCLRNRLFESETTQPMDPTEVVGVAGGDLDRRFNALDSSIRNRIIRDMKAEDKFLQPLIDTCRLTYWQQAALDLAQRDLAIEIHQRTKQGAAMADAAMLLEAEEERITQGEKDRAEDLLYSKPRAQPKLRSSAHMASFRSSIKAS